MNKSQSDGGQQTLSKRRVLPLFIIGGLMVALPLLLVLNWSSNTCSAELLNFCSGSKLFKTSTTILPYVMLAGGALIGYNMKRIHDSLVRRDQEIEDEDKDDSKYSGNDDLR